MIYVVVLVGSRACEMTYNAFEEAVTRRKNNDGWLVVGWLLAGCCCWLLLAMALPQAITVKRYCPHLIMMLNTSSLHIWGESTKSEPHNNNGRYPELVNAGRVLEKCQGVQGGANLMNKVCSDPS